MPRSMLRSYCLLFILMTASSFYTMVPDCSTLKVGRFHSYTKKGDHVQITRIDGIQQDVNIRIKDTTYWKIEWLGNCKFAATYLSGAGPKDDAEKRLYQSSILYFDVQTIADDYYVGTTTVKAPNGNSVFTDTTWLVEKNR